MSRAELTPADAETGPLADVTVPTDVPAPTGGADPAAAEPGIVDPASAEPDVAVQADPSPTEAGGGTAPAGNGGVSGGTTGAVSG